MRRASYDAQGRVVESDREHWRPTPCGSGWTRGCVD
ncbi:hypothetical protein [Brevundimonas sp. EAKA]|nr:hypothetical protein [Brevundimonas sp. EAKA]